MIKISASQSQFPSSSIDIFQGGGAMGEMMRNFDWINHPLGSPELWPQSLKTNIRLMLSSGFPMFIWWSKELYAFNNDAYLPALGKKHPNSFGKKAAIVWAEIWDNIGGIIENIFETQKPFYVEDLLLILERKGFSEETYWTFSYSPVYNDIGEVYGIFCACYESTKQVLGQRRLKVLKGIADAVSHVSTVNQAAKSAGETLLQDKSDIPFSFFYLINRKGDEAILLGKAENINKKYLPFTINLQSNNEDTIWPLNKVLSTKKLELIELNFSDLLTDNTNNPAKAVVVPAFQPGQDQLLGFFISGISPQLEFDTEYQGFFELLAGHMATSIASVQAREDVIRQQQDLANMFQQAPVAIAVVKGPTFIIEVANPAVCEIWRKEQKDVLGKPVLEALPEVTDQGIKELLDNVYNTGVPFVANELPVAFEKKGVMETVYINFVYHPMRNAKGVVDGIIAIAVEVNEQVKARQIIEAKNRELLAINSDLDNFVYSASHDLKAPISNIEGLMQALVRNLPEDVSTNQKIIRLIDLIQASVERFKKAVSDLTEVTKIQRDSGEDITQIDLTEVVKDVKLDFESMINELGAEIKLELAPDAVINFSAKNIRSIIYNLLSNALKYHSPDRKPIITIATQTTPEFIILSVTDNGLGMDTVNEAKIFSMFKRLHDHVEGSGIGLYIVKKIVENAGGKITVESKLNKGTTFNVYFKR